MIRRPFVAVVAILLFEFHNAFAGMWIAAVESDDESVSVRGAPPNIRVDARLIGIVGGMLRVSPTFRDQVLRLGSERRLGVRVVMQEDPTHVARASDRAECQIVRYQFGRIVAEVRLWSWLAVPELIAHEFEHVIEYIEGANYRRLALQSGSRVWVSLDGAFETGRAIEAGKRVAEETAAWSTERPH